MRDDWEEMYRSWKTEREREKMLKEHETKKVEAKVSEIKKKIIRDVDFIERKVSSLNNVSWTNLTKPKHDRFFKIIILIIPILIFGYLIYSNFIASKEFGYFYDIGTEKDNYLTPVSRISGIENTEDYNFRDLTGSLVYFNVPVARGADKIEVSVRFKDNFPENARFSLGAKDKEDWHYKWNQIYNTGFRGLEEFENKEGVYRMNNDLELLDVNELKERSDIIIVSDKPFKALANKIDDYKSEETVINRTLRGGHVFYIYISRDLEMEIKKQDLNWYANEDELVVSLYDSDNILIKELLIEDDGIIDVNKNESRIQTAVFRAEDLAEGVYRLEFGNFDGLIREIKINTNKIVAESLFLADNALYNVPMKETNLYFESKRGGQLRLLTYHSAGLQRGLYSVDGAIKSFSVDNINEPSYINLTEGKYKIKFFENDVIVSGAGYFAFNEKNYFEPFGQRIIGMKNDLNWMKNNVDYLVMDYKAPLNKGDGWIIAETEFSIKEDGLFVKDNKLSMVFSVPHLGRDDGANYTIPIDWIKINVYKGGFVK